MDGSAKRPGRATISLTTEEIEWVSGGKSVVATWFDKFCSWLSGEFSSAPAIPRGTYVSNDTVVEMMRTCVESGGDFYQSAPNADGSNNYTFRDSLGRVATYSLVCKQE